MRVCVLHVNSSSTTSTSPTMRICRFVVSQMPDAAFVHDLDTATQATLDGKDTEPFDVVYVKYGMLAFSDHRKEALHIHNTAKKVISLENDYAFEPDKRFRKADEVWSTVEGRTRYVNWNVLTRHLLEGWEHPKVMSPQNRGLIYYGAWRPGREKYFQQYLDGAPYPVTVSTFRGKYTFGKLTRVKLMPAFRDPDGPALWEATVYIEDEASHSLYCSPANRFYECVHMGLPQAVDEAALETLQLAGIEVPKSHVVRNAMDMRHFVVNSQQFGAEQQHLWRRDYGADILEQFTSARKESGL